MYISFSESGVSTHLVRYQPMWSSTLRKLGGRIYLPRAPSTHALSPAPVAIVHLSTHPVRYQPIFFQGSFTFSVCAYEHQQSLSRCLKTSIFTHFLLLSASVSPSTPPFLDATRKMKVADARGFVAVGRKRHNMLWLDCFINAICSMPNFSK